jgi:predicted GH43/DUF377 family glycosyl hydrolase
MTDIAKRFRENPLLSPGDLRPSRSGLEITCLLNPGVFSFEGKTWILVRVAERPAQEEGMITFPVLNGDGIDVIGIASDDPDLNKDDPRVIRYKGTDYLTTLSHLRLLCSDDGVEFYEPEGFKLLTGVGRHQAFGIEDCRVTYMDDRYFLTFTAVSENGVAVGLRITSDWKVFRDEGLILPPHNKDCAIFEEKINGKYYALHRPSSVDLGGNYIWLAESPDGIHWGKHQCLVRTRPGKWDGARVGAGASPIRTEMGWLEIYHGADAEHRYCLGAFLMDLEDPSVVLARTDEPIMVPTEPYEVSGFFGHVVFTNGHLVRGDELIIYYGAADEHVCGATFSIGEILAFLTYDHAE